MAPVILREGKYTVVMYTRDHPPPHVHVKSAEKEAKISIEPVEMLENWGFKSSEIRAIMDIIQAHQKVLTEKWAEYFSDRE
jgi:hypothetical protein